MTKILATLALATCLILPSNAHAYTLTCIQSANAIVNGTTTQQALAVGHSAGAIDVLAGLFCLGRLPQCACLSSLISAQSDAYSTAFANELVACVNSRPNDPAFLPAMHAARDVCG